VGALLVHLGQIYYIRCWETEYKAPQSSAFCLTVRKRGTSHWCWNDRALAGIRWGSVVIQ